MCGIAGIWEEGVVNNNPLMIRMLDIIAHRGPDGESITKHNDFYLGHKRLAIIDLETGDQPIYNENKKICIIFNGEIYNFHELKKELQQKGHKFYTNSDTETIVHGFEQYGTSFFKRLNGIFAFALLDIANDELYLVRDHFGIKPMHYFFKKGLLVFGSEQKSIILHPKVPRKLNLQALHLQINLRFTQGDETLFHGIKRLPPGYYLKLSKGEIKLNKYWELEYKNINYKMTEDEAIEGIHYYTRQAVKSQLVSDVPIGVYLSGGLDSSTIVQKMHELNVSEINTFTLGFNEPTDEHPDASCVAEKFKTNHHTLNLSMNPLVQFPMVLWHAEEPKINLLQGFNMSQFVQKHLKVVLGGLGGDEIFAGYDIHKYIYPSNWLHANMPTWLQKIAEIKSDILFKLQNSSKLIETDEYRRGCQMLLSLGNVAKFYLILRNVWDFDNEFYENIYHKEFLENIWEIKKTYTYFSSIFEKVNNLKALEQVLFVEMNSKMVNDYLLVEDRMSMANSVEERVPFLDLDLVNFANSIPIHLKIRNNQTKYLFRKAMNGYLPNQIINKKKWGFTVNPFLQFKKDLKSVAEKILTKKFIDEQGIFNFDYLSKILNHKPSPRLRWHYNFLWIATGIAIWQKMFIDSDKFEHKNFSLDDYF